MRFNWIVSRARVFCLFCWLAFVQMILYKCEMSVLHVIFTYRLGPHYLDGCCPAFGMTYVMHGHSPSCMLCIYSCISFPIITGLNGKRLFGRERWNTCTHVQPCKLSPYALFGRVQCSSLLIFVFAFVAVVHEISYFNEYV